MKETRLSHNFLQSPKAPRVYLDQDALIRLGGNSPEALEVRRRIMAGELTVVLSPAHWLDTAGGSSDQNSRDLARFMESLRPLWLPERLDLYRFEFRSFLDGTPFEETRQRAIRNTVSELVAEIGGLVDGGAPIVDPAVLILHLRRNQGARDLFARSYASVAEAAEQNRRRFRAGEITPEVEQRAQALAIEVYGRIRAGSDEHRRLQGAPPDALRALVCEWEATREYWRQSVGMTPSRLRDLFHLVVAMPYTDFILTYDQNLQRTITTVAAQVPFPVARLVCSLGELIEAFDRL